MLLRSLTIADLNGPYDGQTLDLRIENGVIHEMAESLELKSGEQEVLFSDAFASVGFMDIGAYLGDPGHEEREDIASLRAAALAGGYTAVAALPNTDPVRQSVADIAYLLRQNGGTSTDILPIAALSKNLQGKDMTEMMELDKAGALLFSDGPKRKADGSLLKRTLEYARMRDCTVMISPYDEHLVPDGQIHEGGISTQLGLRGIPSMSEIIPLKEAMEILNYTGGKLVVHLLSTAEGVAEVKRAKSMGMNIHATVSAHHLLFTEAELAGFDPNFKMLPPLREETDRQALIEGLKDGTIDSIVSNHVARHGEEKDLEFTYADFGALGLQTAFQECLLALKEHMTLAEIVHRFTYNPGLLLRKESLHLRPGARACLTLFSTAGEQVFSVDAIAGKTVNSPLIGKVLPGKILGVVNNGQFHAVA